MVGNFNAEDSKETLFSFFEKHNAANIVKDKTCIKSLDNLKIVLIFLSQTDLDLFSADLSDFHKMDVTVLKGSFSKARPKEMLHTDYKNFEQDKLKHGFKNRIQNESTEC